MRNEMQYYAVGLGSFVQFVFEYSYPDRLLGVEWAIRYSWIFQLIYISKFCFRFDSI